MRSYDNRKLFFVYIFILAFIALGVRIFYIQIIDPTYKTLAEKTLSDMYMNIHREASSMMLMVKY